MRVLQPHARFCLYLSDAPRTIKGSSLNYRIKNAIPTSRFDLY